MNIFSATNLLHSLDVNEIEIVASNFIEDLVDLRVKYKNTESKLAEREKAVTDFRNALETMRGAALQTAMEYRQELEEVKAEATKQIESLLSSAPSSEFLSVQKRTISPLTPRVQRLFDKAYGRGVVTVMSKESKPIDILAETFGKGNQINDYDAEDSEPQSPGWESPSMDAEMDPRKREMAPAAAAAVASILKAKQQVGSVVSDVDSLMVVDMDTSSSRSSSVGPTRSAFSSPPRGQVAASAQAAAAAAVARMSELEPDSTRDEKTAVGQDLQHGFGVIDTQTAEEVFTRGRPVRERTTSGNSTDPTSHSGFSAFPSSAHRSLSVNNSRESADDREKSKRIISVRRGPPLAPRSVNSQSSDSQPSQPATQYNIPKSTSPVRLGFQRGPVSGTGHRGRSPSWSAGSGGGRESPTNVTRSPQRKMSTPTLSQSHGSYSSVATATLSGMVTASDELDESSQNENASNGSVGWNSEIALSAAAASNSAYWGAEAKRLRQRLAKFEVVTSHSGSDPSAASEPANIIRKKTSGASLSSSFSLGAAISPNAAGVNGDVDVFSRLATSHTLSSQAKVIHRNEREAAAASAAAAIVVGVPHPTSAGSVRKGLAGFAPNEKDRLEDGSQQQHELESL
jgi:hypothetical protein